jgi:hypothetical protein
MWRMGGSAPGWHPDPSGRWQVRWWDGAAWTEHVASQGRQGSDPAPGGAATADLVNRVVAAALGFVELEDTMPGAVPETTITPALWRDADSRPDILLLAKGHLESLEHQGSDPARAKALTYLKTALDSPPLMPR